MATADLALLKKQEKEMEVAGRKRFHLLKKRNKKKPKLLDKLLKDGIEKSTEDFVERVKGILAAHPASDGWAKLVFTGIDPKGEPKFKTIPYNFDRDGGKSLAQGKAAWKKRVDGLGTMMREEVRGLFLRAQNGDTAAQNILSQASWYREMRTRLRREFGGLGDLFADLLGGTSPNTPVKGNWDNALDVLRRATRGDWNAMMPKWEAWAENVERGEMDLQQWVAEKKAAGVTITALKRDEEYNERRKALSALRKLPQEMLPRKENGALYGFNGRNVVRGLVGLWRTVREKDPSIGRGATAPKALNFSGNLIGFRTGATIDVWAARLLQRLAGGLRIPSVAEGGVKGSMLTSGDTTGAFRLGQDAFQDAVDKIRADSELAQNPLLASLNPDDLQAIVWFLEKEVWTINDWTSVAGEGGSFEFEADLAGVADTARVKELRRIIDSKLSTKDQKTAAMTALKAMMREADGFVGGISVQQDVPTQGEDYVPGDAHMEQVQNALKLAAYSGNPGSAVLAMKAYPSEGRYGTSVERAFDVEVVGRQDFSPDALWTEMLRQSRDNNQDAVYLSRKLRAAETIDPARHRPGIEVYFRAPLKTKAEVDAMVAKIRGSGIEFMTLIVDPTPRASARAGAMPAVVGVRSLFLPEFSVRFGDNSLVGADEATVTAAVKAKAKALDEMGDDLLSKVDGVNFADIFWYDTATAFSHEYDTLLGRDDGDSRLGGNDPKDGAAPWKGISNVEAIERAAARNETSSRAAERRALRGEPGADARGVDQDAVNPARPAPAPVTRGVSAKAAEQALSLIRQSLPAVADATRIVTNREALADEIGDYRPQDWADMGPGGVQAFYDPRTGQTTIFLENIEVREGETPMRAVARIILHERIAHAGLAVLRQSDPAFARQWQQLTGQIPREELEAIAERYPELSGNLDALAEEWLASQVEARAGRLLPSTSLAGKMWAALKAAIARVFGKFSRSEPLAAEVDRMIFLARNALKVQFVQQDLAMRYARNPGNPASEFAGLFAAQDETSFEAGRKFLAQLYGALAQHDEVFQFSRTASKSAKDIAAAVSLEGREIMAFEGGGSFVHFGSATGNLIVRDADTNRPWIRSDGADSKGKKQGGGSQLYAAALDWIHNNGKRIKDDDAGLTEINAIRRTSNFLASALRWGTTKHLKPHDKQGVRWGEDNQLNIAALAAKEMRHAFKAIAKAQEWSYDFTNGQFRDNAGNNLTRQDFESAVSLGDPGRSGIGLSTLQRAVITQSALRAFERGETSQSLLGAQDARVAPVGLSYARPGQRSAVRYAGTGPYRVQNQGWRATLTGNALPKEFAALLTQGKNETAALQQAAALIGQDLNVAIAAHAKRHGLTEADVLTLVDDAMANPTTLYALQDRPLREATRKARNFLDDMSDAVATLTGGQLGSAIMANRGSWMRRSYAAFDPAAGWHYDAMVEAAKAGKPIAGQPAAKILKDARDFLLAEDPARTPGQIENILRSLMDRTNWERALTGQGVSKPTESLMRRKELPAALRAVMGEERNPLKRYTLSAGFQAAFIARHEQQERMAQIGQQMGIFSTQQTGVYTEELSDGAPTAQGQRRSGLAGLYTTPEMKAALSRAQGTTPDNLIYKAGDLIKFLSGEAKLNKVALSPDSYMVNLIGNVIGLVQTGDLLTLSTFGRMAEAIKVMNSGRPLAALGTAQAVLQETRRAHLARITAAGVADSSYSMADLQSSLDSKLLQFIEADNLWNRASGGVRGAVLGQGLGRIFGGAGQAIGAVTGAAVGTALGGKRIVDAQKQIAQWTLGAPDRFGKIIAFQNNYEAHLASGMSDQAAFDLATEKTLNTMPDYSKMPELAKQLSQLGLMGSFIGFQIEVYRNAYHNFKYAAKELASGKPALMALGARRFLGASTVQALAVGGFQAIIAGIFGQGASDDEDEAYRRSLAKPYEKFGRLAYTTLDGEKAGYFNTSYLLPQVTMWEIGRAALSGDSFETALENAAVAGRNQFAGGGVHTDPMLEALMNARKDGRPVSTETGYRQGAERVVYYLRRALEPGAIDKLDRTVRAMDGRDRNSRTFTLEEEGLRLLGVRQTTYKHTETIKSRLYELDGAYTAAAATARTSWKDNAPGERAAAITRANTRIAGIRADYEQFTKDLTTLRLLPLLQTVNDNRSADGTRRPILPKEFKPLVDTPDGPKPMSSK